MKLIVRLLFLFCSISIFAQSEYTMQSVSPKLRKHSNSVVIKEVTEFDASNIKKITIKKSRVIAVLNKNGDRDTQPYEFYSENSKVKKIEATIYDGNGRQLRRYKKKDFMDVSRTDGSIYQDSRMLYLDYTPATYPYIMVIESEVETGDSGLYGRWFPLSGYVESVKKNIFKIKFDPKNKPRYKGKNLDGYNITISESPNELIFTAENLEAIRYEAYAPSTLEILPHVLFTFDNFYLKKINGTAKDWKEFGQWMEKSLLSDTRDLPEATISKMRSLVANETTNEAKARKIYQYVQNKVRYVDIQIGIGGWKPMPASDVDKLSYGDCKALTNYTKTLLDAVGVPSYYTIVYGDRSLKNLDEDFASLQGNHVILGIPDGDEITWLECTSQDVPYGYIGSFTDDRSVLMITPEGGKLTRTKSYPSQENTQETRAKVRVDEKGHVKATYESVSKGVKYEDKYTLPRLTEREVDHFYKKQWRYINGFSISNIEFINDKEAISFTEKMEVEMPNYANAVGQDYLLTLNIFNHLVGIPPQADERKQKLSIVRGFLDVDTIDIEIDEGFQINSLPEPTLIENKFGSYKISIEKISDSKFKYHRKLHIEKGEYSPEDYEEFREFLRSVGRLDNNKVLLEKTK